MDSDQIKRLLALDTRTTAVVRDVVAKDKTSYHGRRLSNGLRMQHSRR